MFARGQELGAYRLDRKLGHGAFGEVWLATERSSDGSERRVAVKLITALKESQRVADLLHEATLCASIDHPNVLVAEGVVQHGDAHFLVMEYIDGEDLARLFKDLNLRGLRIPRSVVLDVGIAICDALDAAWNAVGADGTALRIVHRDMKPHNVMLSRDGRVKVADFGIAKAAPDLTMTATGVLKGTPTYGAPELWRGSRDFQPAVDLYGVGVMLWELATGERFYGRATVPGVLEIMAERTAAEEAAYLKPAFPELAAILPSLLARSAAARANDAGDVAARLREARSAVAAPGSLADFVAGVRAARVQRAPGVSWEPDFDLVEPLEDWAPLLEAARVGAPRKKAADTLVRPRKASLGPATGTEVLSPGVLPTGATRSGSGTWIPWLGAALAAIVVVVLLKAKGYL